MKKINQDNLLAAAKYSIAFVWAFTGLTSLFFSPEIGYKILAGGNISGSLADVAIYAGGFLDIVLGLWLLTGVKTKLCCMVQVTTVATYTLLLTFIDIGFWLHPFGPITKNLPIIVLIGYIYVNDVHSTSVSDKDNH